MYFFFFQAEDGIRDYKVTGVQTCALPILSGWQVAADGNTSETMYPDQSLYAYDSVPTMVRRINNTFKRADEIQWGRGINPGDKEFIDYFLPIVADAEAGFGGVLNAFELMKNMIAAGAAGVHFEDQLAAVKKCGHIDRKSTRLNSSHLVISYAVFCLKNTTFSRSPSASSRAA